jgi:hypothetical protein
MIVAMLAAQLAVSTPGAYASEALRSFVADVAAANARVPRALGKYEVMVESDVVAATTTADGAERVLGVEQVAQRVVWGRHGGIEQQVVGYRAEAAMLTPMSALATHGWTIPVLYGNRFDLLLGPYETSRERDTDGRRRGRLDAVHPLAADRDAIYRFEGGDTVEVIAERDRRIPVVRIDVAPVPLQAPSRPTTVFRGALYVDAARHQLIGMRGEILEIGGRPSLAGRLAWQLARTRGYVDVRNREVEGRYWLPGAQRLEVQVSSGVTGSGQLVWRFHNRFGAYRITPADTTSTAYADTSGWMQATTRELHVANDSVLATFDAWTAPIGAASAALRATDFADIRRTSAVASTALEWYVPSFDESLRFDRVEGVYSGGGLRVRAVGPSSDLAVGAYAGWAWSAQTVRGGAFVEGDRHRWRWSVAARRSIDVTNDFAALPQRARTLAALIGGRDDADYVDRRTLGVTIDRAFARQRSVLRLEVGAGADHGVASVVSRGLVRRDSAFRENRPVTEGRYRRARLSVVWHRDVRAELARPGWSATAAAEAAGGELRWTRIDAGAGWRGPVGPLTATARLDGSVVGGSHVPLQQILEVGREAGMPGFAYKELGGDRGAIGRLSLRYRLPFLQRPIPARRGVLPSLAPLLAAGIRAVAIDASPETLASLEAFGTRPTAGALAARATRPTGGVRASTSAGVMLFGGAVFAGLSRRVDAAGAWRWTVMHGTAF